MKYNTRFNPTISGPLHIGHLYMALVNEAEAHRSGGKFIVRVDDTNRQWSHRLSWLEQSFYYQQYKNQLSQFMHIDGWTLQSWMDTLEEIIGDNPFLGEFQIANWDDTITVEWRTAINQKIWQYSPYLTIFSTPPVESILACCAYYS